MFEGMAFVFVAIALAMPLVGPVPLPGAVDLVLRGMIILNSRRTQHRSINLAAVGPLLRHVPRAIGVLRDAVAGCDLFTLMRPSELGLGGHDLVAAVVNTVVC
jgi:hypothetical protein